MIFNNNLFTRIGEQHGYAAPSVTVLDYQNEGLLCQSSEFNFGGGGSYTDDDINDNGEY